MHVAICFYDTHDRHLSLTPGEREAFLHTALGMSGSL